MQEGSKKSTPQIKKIKRNVKALVCSVRVSVGTGIFPVRRPFYQAYAVVGNDGRAVVFGGHVLINRRENEFVDELDAAVGKLSVAPSRMEGIRRIRCVGNVEHASSNVGSSANGAELLPAVSRRSGTLRLSCVAVCNPEPGGIASSGIVSARGGTAGNPGKFRRLVCCHRTGFLAKPVVVRQARQFMVVDCIRRTVGIGIQHPLLKKAYCFVCATLHYQLHAHYRLLLF